MINPYAKDYRYLKSPDNNDEEDLEWMLTIIGVVIGSVLLCSLVVLVFMRKCMVHRL